MDRPKIIIGRANLELGNKIAEYIGVKPVYRVLKNFADGEIRFQIKDNIRGDDVFIIQSTFPPSENIVELLLMIDAAKRASARRITVVIPYYGYARQDRKDQPRVPISAKLISNLITTAGADRLLTLDLHSPQIQGFFDILSDHLSSDGVFKWYLEGERIIPPKDERDRRYLVASPDVGGVKRIEDFSESLSVGIAVVYKRRTKPNQSEAIDLIGDVTGATVIIKDDIIDTGGTLAKAAELLMKKGAKEVHACCTHPLLSSKKVDDVMVSATEIIDKSPIQSLIVTDTIPITEEKSSPKIKIVSIAHLFAAAINNIHLEKSVSVLFQDHPMLHL
ncbi:ribose-phosphate pyrophosphokinase [bacterium]|nr:ribose-phosphate pyrophosphokinase [bacterium]